MSAPLVVIDADVLGRQRTGDETYVRNLLRELPPPTPNQATTRKAAVRTSAEATVRIRSCQSVLTGSGAAAGPLRSLSGRWPR